MPIYMRIEGLEGESTDKRFPGWFEISSYSWGEDNTVSQSGGGGGAGKVSVHDISITKRTGKGSPALFLHCASGKLLPAVQFVVTVPRQGRGEPYLKISLTDILVSSYRQSDDSSGRPQDDVSFNFGKIEFDQSVFMADGSVTVESAFWDVRGNRGG